MVNDPSRNTQGGFMVGGWADRNRYFSGWLAGVRFYNSCLAARWEGGGKKEKKKEREREREAKDNGVRKRNED